MASTPRADEELFPELFREGPIVDRHKASRVVPMKVLVFGLMRTGTTSIRAALLRLGYHDVYHMVSAIANPDDAQWWMRASNAKWNNKGTLFTREDWDKLLGHCQAVCDIPPAAFAEELIAAYPEAKVMILNRDVDKWYESMKNTVIKAASPNPWRMLRAMLDWRETGQVGMMIGTLMAGMFGGAEGMTESNMKKVFIEYHENLRRIVPKERLLEFKVQDGYKPLCDFLEVPVPTTLVDEKEIEEPFPRVNEGAVFMQRLVVQKRLSNRRIMKKTGTFVGVFALVGAGLWYLRGR